MACHGPNDVTTYAALKTRLLHQVVLSQPSAYDLS